jgi:hypothetical protein
MFPDGQDLSIPEDKILPTHTSRDLSAFDVHGRKLMKQKS